MSRPSSCDARVAALSRELALVIDETGAVTWADERAERLIGPLGATLRDHATPGTEAKVERLVAQAIEKDVERFEVSLLSGGRPATFAFRAEPCEGGAVLVGLNLSDEEQATFANV